MKSRIIIPLIILITCSIVSCENRPKEVLSRSEMEDVLYDYHIMQGLIEQLPAEERLGKAQDYINAVYLKHGITEAQFDTSVTYYNRHPKDLYKIYKSLEQRYTAANEEMQLVNGNNDMMAIYATGGDTTNLWNSKRLLLLRSREFVNRESFTIHADTTSIAKTISFSRSRRHSSKKAQTMVRALICMLASASCTKAANILARCAHLATMVHSSLP